MHDKICLNQICSCIDRKIAKTFSKQNEIKSNF
jgi:hypothetical protein